ncbi:MAG: DUF3536 domain-containing protein [Chitinivibrionales bacterium]|nr:DUF3536 domain-containing protein [Chitinivibrionales bacterium]
MSKYVCIHGHFYQPPRENPWLEEIEQQDSAYPFHDWNERISAECYAPNTASRLLDHEGRIIDIVNNYSRISFNFGPTLLSWMERREPDSYQAILDADRLSRERFSGHGSALAQCYNHMIMPLANERDKRTQVVWGITDFERRFQRAPEGMWLPETAVDTATLELLAEYGITFTILAPRQAKRIREIGSKEWTDVSEGTVDPRMPYRCKLPSGRSIVLFFYDGPVSQDIAFGGLLDNGEYFAQRLVGVFDESDEPQLAHIATDGESYGHHHRHGDMALAYCLHHLASDDLAEITIYGEFLEKHPPTYEAEIIEKSSWSCIHGVERWRNDCGCCTGMHGGWQQQWRAPLRGALDWLRDSLTHIYETKLGPLVTDVWKARDAYIELVLNRSIPIEETPLDALLKAELTDDDRVTVLKSLEMQRHAMLMYTSCGWFFDEISGIETTQVMAYAARAIQLARQLSGMDLEETFASLLERAPSNVEGFGNGRYAYDNFIKPAELDLVRVGAHFSVSALFEDYPESTQIYCYKVETVDAKRAVSGGYTLYTGTAEIKSIITTEEAEMSFAVLHFGDCNVSGGVRKFIDEQAFRTMRGEVLESFERADVPGTLHRIEKHFGTGSYSLWHLFRDERRKVLDQILSSTLQEIEMAMRQIRDHNYAVIETVRRVGLPLPGLLTQVVSSLQGLELQRAIEKPEIDIGSATRVIEESRRWGVGLDKTTISFSAKRSLEHLAARLMSKPEDLEPLNRATRMISLLRSLGVEIDLWWVQNAYFKTGKLRLAEMHARANRGDKTAQKWLEAFSAASSVLKVRVE